MPSKPLTAHIALFRGINVGGNKKLPMARLRELCEELGFNSARTYIQSGNLVFRCSLGQAEVERTIEEAVKQEFGFHADVIARSAKQWRAYAKAPAFPEAAEERAKFLHLGLSKQKPAKGCVAKLQEYAKREEQVALRGDALWVDYAGGAGRSKITPAVLDRAVGSSVTMRNWRSVLAIAQLLDEIEDA